MSLAIFGITNSGLNLAASLFLLMLIVLWLALIVYTFLDARRRIADPFLVACATIASFFPFIGTAVYAIVRPPEYLEDAHERELEIRAAELRVRQLKDQSCPNCEYPVEKNFLRCPNCERRLKDPCPTCGKPVDPRWTLCPYCESTLAGERRRRPQRRPEGEAERRPRSAEREEGEAKRPRRKKAAVGGAAAKPGSDPGQKNTSAPASTTKREPARGANEAPANRTEQRSPSREPDPDPRQA
jgi:double zinc ribbon protein